ncbi:MAG: DUF1801 domain-containing protein [Cyclobacteriaceae bacterium]
MQYKAKTPQEYLEKLEIDWRKIRLEEIRAMIKRAWPEAIEGIEYNMLCYGNGAKNIIHLNAQKAYVALYVGDIHKVENFDSLLEGFDRGKGCVRIRRTLDLSKTGLAEFVARVVKIHQEGGDTDC